MEETVILPIELQRRKTAVVAETGRRHGSDERAFSKNNLFWQELQNSNIAKKGSNKRIDKRFTKSILE